MSQNNSPSHTSPHSRLGYGPDEAAKVISLGRTKFFELLRAKKVGSVLVGRRRIIPWSELERIMREGA